ncbi:hypothetical protein JRQ81_018575 [Phrynocephalus forsythii]|uniref:Uncharacterized protein n=1 Tax=Phrynocephalus forsythii TaxID=171643 RepID=A0A9Q0XNU7_9SAUR|nr:hypothetical protein JRQ81_018575 [Phrynocephalus forsythii]
MRKFSCSECLIPQTSGRLLITNNITSATAVEHFRKKRQDRTIPFLPHRGSETQIDMSKSVHDFDASDDVSGSECKSSKEKKKKEKPKMVTPFAIFRYADWPDTLLMAAGTIFAAVHGASLPVMMIVFGDMTNSFVQSGIPISNISLGNFSLGNFSFDNMSQYQMRLYRNK